MSIPNLKNCGWLSEFLHTLAKKYILLAFKNIYSLLEILLSYSYSVMCNGHWLGVYLYLGFENGKHNTSVVHVREVCACSLHENYLW